jgi:hypothetical protein
LSHITLFGFRSKSFLENWDAARIHLHEADLGASAFWSLGSCAVDKFIVNWIPVR